jgi:hypothetical protein
VNASTPRRLPSLIRGVADELLLRVMNVVSSASRALPLPPRFPTDSRTVVLHCAKEQSDLYFSIWLASQCFAVIIDVFTPDEHAILADWFRTESPGWPRDILRGDAAKRLSFAKKPLHYLLNDCRADRVIKVGNRSFSHWKSILFVERSTFAWRFASEPHARRGITPGNDDAPF